MFKNFSDVKFLDESANRLVKLQQKVYEAYSRTSTAISTLNGVLSPEYNTLTRKRRSLEITHHRLSGEILEKRELACIRQYQDSKFGVILMSDNSREYSKIYKTTSGTHIDAWLFDLIRNDDEQSIQEMFKPISASQFIQHCENHHLTNNEFEGVLYNEALKIRKEELSQFRTLVTWSKQEGLSVFNKKMFWLFANDCKSLPKLNGVVYTFKNKRISMIEHVGKWHGVNFAINGDYNSHEAPKNWVMGKNGIVYPINYARKRNMVIRGATVDSPTLVEIGKISSISLSFSHKLGYFDSNVHVAYRGKLYKKDQMITLNTGKQVPKEEARFVARYNTWFESQDVVEAEGVWELRVDCLLHDGDWYHNSTSKIKRCNLCGGTHHSSYFVTIDSTDPESPEVCSNCHSNIKRMVSRLCYSTNVIDYKGFGSTPMKINGEGVYLGLELETYADYNDETRSDIALKLNKFAAGKQNYTVPTRDGSLCSEHGVEYIFRPEGLINQKRNVNEFIQKVGDCLVEDAGDGYGLHIHVSDHFLTTLDKIRIDNFVSMFEGYFRKIGGRGDTEYQHKKTIQNNRSLRQCFDSKYKMVNIGRRGTIEYRFPKSLVNEVHISMNLEMAQAVTLYCKYHLSSIKLDTRSEKASALKGFIDYVSTNKKTYPLLHAENNANIKLDRLESYSEFCKKALKAKKYNEAQVDTYTLAA